MVVGGQTVCVASIEHLIAMKRAAGRPHDLDDIRALVALAARRSPTVSSDRGGDDAWAVGRFDGLRLAQARDAARLTAQQRLDWLDDALELARASGARAERARSTAASWENPPELLRG